MTDTPETKYGGPFFIPDEDPTADQLGITTEIAARAISEPGLPIAKATSFFRNKLQAGHLHPYSRSRADKRRPYLFRADQVLAAAIFHRLSESGFVGDSVFQSAGLTLNSWQAKDLNGQDASAPNPASWAFRSFMAGYRNFGFELITMRNMGTVEKPGRGELKFSARIRQTDPTTKQTVGTSFWNPGPTWQRRSVWATDLDPILAHITRNKGNH